MSFIFDNIYTYIYIFMIHVCCIVIPVGFKNYKDPIPIGSMDGILAYIYHQNQLSVGKYTVHGSYGILLHTFFSILFYQTFPHAPKHPRRLRSWRVKVEPLPLHLHHCQPQLHPRRQESLEKSTTLDGYSLEV